MILSVIGITNPTARKKVMDVVEVIKQTQTENQIEITTNEIQY